MSYEQAIFKALKAKATADTGSGGMFESGGASFLTGGFRLEGESMRTRSVPRIDVVPPDAGRMDAGGADIWTGVWRLRVSVARDRAFGTGDTPENAGVLSAVIDRVEAVFDKTGLTVTGYSPSTLSISRVFRGREDETTAVRIVEFTVVACK